MLPATYNTIKVKKFLDIQEEWTATAVAITPGMLLEQTSAGLVQAHATQSGNVLSAFFALEDELQGKLISDKYLVSTRIQVWCAVPGEEVYALLADGESVTKGDPLESAGGGYLQKHVADTLKDSSATNIYTKPIVAESMETLDLSSSSGLESSALEGPQRLLVKIV